MAFKIQIVAAAERDIDEALAYIHQSSPDAARRWLESFQEKIQGLTEMPSRFALIAEADELKKPLSSFVHHSHRVVYEIDKPTQIVSILRVYHSARAPLSLEDLTS